MTSLRRCEENSGPRRRRNTRDNASGQPFHVERRPRMRTALRRELHPRPQRDCPSLQLRFSVTATGDAVLASFARRKNVLKNPCRAKEIAWPIGRVLHETVTDRMILMDQRKPRDEGNFSRVQWRDGRHIFSRSSSVSKSPSRFSRGTQHSPVDSVTLKINKGFTLDPAHPLPPLAPFSTSFSSTYTSYSPRLSQERIAGVDGSTRLWWSDDRSFY